MSRPAAASFDAAARQRLVHMLGMMGSEHDGEVINAARMAGRLVRTYGLAWGDVIAVPALPPPSRSKAKRLPDWPELAQSILDSGAASAWEVTFAESLLANWRGRRLSERQKSTLAAIWDQRCGGSE